MTQRPSPPRGGGATFEQLLQESEDIVFIWAIRWHFQIQIDNWIDDHSDTADLRESCPSSSGMLKSADYDALIDSITMCVDSLTAAAP